MVPLLATIYLNDEGCALHEGSQVNPHAEPQPADRMFAQVVVAGVDDDRVNIAHVRNIVGNDGRNDNSDRDEDYTKAVSTTVGGGGG